MKHSSTCPVSSEHIAVDKEKESYHCCNHGCQCSSICSQPLFASVNDPSAHRTQLAASLGEMVALKYARTPLLYNRVNTAARWLRPRLITLLTFGGPVGLPTRWCSSGKSRIQPPASQSYSNPNPNPNGVPAPPAVARKPANDLLKFALLLSMCGT